MIDRGFATFMTVFGIILGFIAGRFYQQIVIAYKAWQGARKNLPILFRAFFALVRGALGIALVILVVVGAMMVWTAGAMAPTPSPSRSGVPAQPVRLTPTPR